MIRFENVSAFYSEKADEKVYRLSGGEKRRTAIARTLMQKPTLLLADEILSDLDFMKAKMIMEKIRALKAEFGLTVVMVEHDLYTAKELADNILLLKNGEMISDMGKLESGNGKLCTLFR